MSDLGQVRNSKRQLTRQTLFPAATRIAWEANPSLLVHLPESIDYRIDFRRSTAPLGAIAS
jgi:hypothetical protein